MDANSTNVPDRNAGLDAVRVLATFMIVVYHVISYDVAGINSRHASALGAVAARLNVGVQMFFVLSGFLVARPFVGRFISGDASPPLIPYLVRRGARILPAYWVALIILAMFGAIEIPDPMVFTKNALLVHTLDSRTVFTGITQSWTLAIEMSFYLAMPFAFLCIAPLRRHLTPAARSVALALLLLLIAANAYIFRAVTNLIDIDFLKASTVLLPTHMDTLALGMLIAVLLESNLRHSHFLTLTRFLQRASVPLLVLAVVTWSASSRIGLPLAFEPVSLKTELLGHFLYSLSAFLFLIPFCIAFPTSRIQKWSSLGPIPWLASVSFGIYLWHRVLLSGSIADRFMPFHPNDGRVLVRLLVTVPVSIAIGATSYHLVERPIVRAVARRTHPPLSSQK